MVVFYLQGNDWMTLVFDHRNSGRDNSYPRVLSQRSTGTMSSDDCIFCKIVKGAIPCHKLFENEHVLCFLDIGPLSVGHCLVIPKEHGEQIDNLSDTTLAAIGPALKQAKIATGVPACNVLQNNGKLAHQEVMHVHFHVIPKTSEDDGLGVGWNGIKEKPDFPSLLETMRNRIQ
jgi:diadenosine tetraphosphate (Ap4A) HIT family hydrolase